VSPGLSRCFLIALISLLTAFVACSDENLDYSTYPDGEIVVDSISIYVVRGLHPSTGQPAGEFVCDIYFEMEWQPGAICKIEIFPSPPAEYTTGVIYNSYSKNEPLPINTLHEHHEDLWYLYYDFIDEDSIWVYFAIEAKFWRQVESRIQENTILIPRGEDRWFQTLKIDVRDE